MQTGTTALPRKRLIVVATIDNVIEGALGKQLRGLDYDVHFVRKGSELLLEALENDVDVLILDLEVVGMSGMDILPILRKMRPRLPIILITEDYTYRVRKVVAEQGITYQTFKPMTPAEAGMIRLAAEKILQKKNVVELTLV